MTKPRPREPLTLRQTGSPPDVLHGSVIRNHVTVLGTFVNGIVTPPFLRREGLPGTQARRGARYGADEIHPSNLAIISRMKRTAAGPLSALAHSSRAIFSCNASASGADVIIATPTRMFGSSPSRNGLSAKICRSG